jgi:hypothetical protein
MKQNDKLEPMTALLFADGEGQKPYKGETDLL